MTDSSVPSSTSGAAAAGSTSGGVAGDPSSGGGFRVTTSAAPEATTVSVVGSVDMVTAPPFGQAVAAAQAEQPRAVLIDLSGVDFLGSAGLSVLVDAARRAADGGSAMVIVAETHPVVHALAVTGLDSVLTIVPTTAQALRRLAGEGTTDS